MLKNRRSIISTKHSGDTNQLTTLSLFLMLLAFFIVLNVNSNYEVSRSVPVLQSIERTFSPKVVGYEEKENSATESQQKVTGQANAIDQLQATFKAEIPGLKVTVKKDLDLMSTTISRLKFRNMILEKSPAISRIREILNRFIESDKGYVMDMVFYFEQDPAKESFDSPENYKNFLKEVQRYIPLLQEAGFDRRTISLSFFKGNVDDVTLMFKTRTQEYVLPDLEDES